MLVQADASGLEWRILVLLSRDPIGIKEIQEGQDIHKNNQISLNLPDRLTAKKFLFRTIYRGSGWAFARDNEFRHISSDPEFWDNKNAEFYRKYGGIDRCHQTWAVQAANTRMLSGPSGRSWRIDPKPNGDTPWTTLTNYPVQGTAADLMTLARVSLRNRLKTGKLQSLLISTVHDSLVADVCRSEVDKVKELMYNTFNDLPKNISKFWGIESPIPFPCEIKVGHNLGDMSE
jgi:DNA polymerase-1